ncbi:MAG: DegV family protein [Lachnospiraceae bacterium]|nr:DegV family protein [Lachnospiraceae bacterium]
MQYKIVVDSCCELPEEYLQDPRFQRIPLTLEVGEDYRTLDDDSFDQKAFLQAVASSPECPRSACPSPALYAEACDCDAEHVYIITLSSHLSGSYNSAVLGRDLYLEEHEHKDIFVIDSESASCGETQIAMELMELEAQGLSFEEITRKISNYRSNIRTFFVLDSLEALRKNGRLSAVKALVASTLSIKPIMAGCKGIIIQKAQCIGMKKALSKLAEEVVAAVPRAGGYSLMITHCNAPERAEQVRRMIQEKMEFVRVSIMDTRGVSSLYASDGGVIVTIAANLLDSVSDLMNPSAAAIPVRNS